MKSGSSDLKVGAFICLHLVQRGGNMTRVNLQDIVLSEISQPQGTNITCLYKYEVLKVVKPQQQGLEKWING